MMITDIQTKQMLAEVTEYNKLSFTMLVNRLRRHYVLENKSDKVLSECTEEINYFLNKYQHAMAADYEYVQKRFGNVSVVAA